MSGSPYAAAVFQQSETVARAASSRALIAAMISVAAVLAPVITVVIVTQH